ncbi:MAG: hypothetical protein HFE43_11400 [Oscillospiraceae bacterium]|jgi:hypothetical protein|nr:hypothetical protein [Oscillospiraceae bacterium]
MALENSILEQAVNLRALTGLKDVFATKKELENIPAGGAITFATAEDVVALFQDLDSQPDAPGSEGGEGTNPENPEGTEE